MSPSKRLAALLALSLSLTAPLRAGDPFSLWKASGFFQALGLQRLGSLPPAGPLDSDSHEATGLARDGLFLRKLETKLSGPLGPDGWSAVLGAQSDGVTAGTTDLIIQRESASKRWTLKLGQMRLPFGQEGQTSGGKLLGIQRALALNFGNYGHVDNWGLGLFAERSLGARVDAQADPATWLHTDLQFGGFQAKGQSFAGSVSGLGRWGWRAGSAAWGLAWGASGGIGRPNLSVTSAQYVPLGSSDSSSSAWIQGPGTGGKVTVLTWGQDASLDLGLLHGRAEWVMQSLGDLTREGGKLSAFLELPLEQARLPYAYVSWDQATSSFADGVHRPGALYRARTLGASCPLPWQSSLKLEFLKVSGDDFPGGFASDQLYQGQWQFDF